MNKSLLVLSLLVLLAGCASKVPAPVEDRSQPLGSSGIPPDTAGYHTVKKGETLYSIALEYGQDYREMAAWNNITDPHRITIGQSLRVQPPGGQDATVVAPVIAHGAVEQRPLDSTPAAADTSQAKMEPRVNKEPYSDPAYARLQSEKATAAPTAPTSTESTPSTSSTEAAVAGVTWAWPATGKVTGKFQQTKGVDIAGKAGDPVLASADGKVVYSGSGLRGYGQLVIIKHDATFLSAYAHNQKILVKEGQSVKRGQKIAEMGSTDSDSVKLHFEIRRQGKPVEPLEFLPKR
ncbi:MAG: peptidoglycan DD-metalloendopeptidase family protein [Azovibrio sp.]